MNLEKFLTYDPRITVSILQEAYFDIITKIRLMPALLPVNLQTTAHANGFITKAETYNRSEIAIKEIHDIIGCNLSTDVSMAGGLNTLEIGDIATSGYGFATFDEMNLQHKVIPDVLWYNDVFYCEDTNPALFILSAYIYPYPVLIEAGSNPFSNVMEYDIQDMITTYTSTDLKIDNVLFFFVYLKALAIYSVGEGNLSLAGYYNKVCIQYITLYNQNPKWITKNIPTIIATFTGGAL